MTEVLVIPRLDCTIAGAASNCYVTLAYADAHFADTLPDGRCPAFRQAVR